MTTLQIIDAVVTRLESKIAKMAVESFPERPSEYRLNHPRGALLVSYAGGRFGVPNDTGIVVQSRIITLSITVVMRQLNGNGGAIEVLDQVRHALTGFKPPNCRRKMWAISEKFLGESAGLWQYALDMSTEGVQVEELDADQEPLLQHLTTQDNFNRTEIRKAADGTIIQEESNV